MQSLLSKQDLHIAAPVRGGNGGIEQRLGEKTARKSEGLCVCFSGALSALNPCQPLHPRIRETDGSQEEPPARRLFKRQLCLVDGRIFLKRCREGGVEADRIRSWRPRGEQGCGDKRQFATLGNCIHRWAPKVGGGAVTSRTDCPALALAFPPNLSSAGSRAEALARRARATLCR